MSMHFCVYYYTLMCNILLIKLTIYNIMGNVRTISYLLEKEQCDYNGILAILAIMICMD